MPQDKDLIEIKYQSDHSTLPEGSALRLDQFLSTHIQQFSRAQLQRLIAEKLVLVNGKAEKPSFRLRQGDEIKITVLPPVASTIEPQAIPLDIVYEDEYLAVINKSAGIAVHPGAGIQSGTLVHALLHHMHGSLSGIGGVMRPGIVHRLDKDTSGLLVIAKADRIHQHLAKQIQNKQAKRIYLAVLEGVLPGTFGVVDAPIGRHPGRRTEMAIVKDGRTAQTAYTVLASAELSRTAALTKGSRLFSFSRLELKTGRTHQIRVHMASLNCPVVGDLIYNRKSTGTLAIREKLGLIGQALHAHQLSFVHPVSSQLLQFMAPMPADWSILVKRLFPTADNLPL